MENILRQFSSTKQLLKSILFHVWCLSFTAIEKWDLEYTERFVRVDFDEVPFHKRAVETSISGRSKISLGFFTLSL